MCSNRVRLPHESAVFIDVPNASLYDEDREAFMVEFGVLALHALTLLPESPEASVRLYKMLSRNRSTSSWMKRVQHRAGIEDLHFETIAGKDIDSLIINDIWKSVSTALRVAAEQNDFPARVAHVLVSGDGDYLRAYRSVFEAFGDSVDIELHVIGWDLHLHHGYEGYATSVSFLDDIPGFKIPSPR